MIWTGKIEVQGQETVPLPFCPSKIPCELVGLRTRAPAVRASNAETT